MKLKIVSDGTPTGTRVLDAATGEMVEGVTSVITTASVGNPPKGN